MHNVTVAFAVLLVMLLSYFFGCFNGSFMVSHFIIRDDVRKHGSGNAGLTNFYRTYGAKYALLVIACDMGKTVAACLLGSFFFRCLGWDGTLGTLLAGLGCELGHIFPVFYGLRGGKGILSGGVVAIMIDWRIAVVVWGGFLILTALTRYVSLGSLWAGASFPFISWYCYPQTPIIVLAFCLGGLIVWKHRANIQRLLAGNENKLSFHRKKT